MSKWKVLKCESRDLQLIGTLNGGQSFRWNKVKSKCEDHWIGVFKGQVWILNQNKNEILYQVYNENDNNRISKKRKFEQNGKQMLSEYFQLDFDLEKHYAKWSKADPYFKKASKQFYGIRILKQDVTENIFSFICSSNNNISRISSMVEKLAQFYGKEICEIDGITYYSFPNVEDLAQDGVEEKLKENGFGYRAKYISKSAQTIVKNGGEKWLQKLEAMNYKDAKTTLMTLMGIGAKVSDCICLMSLGHLEAIPVDTHIYQIAKRLYIPKLSQKKTVTESIYNEIGDHFRKMYGPSAGWAHTVLFCADLKKFQVDNAEPEAEPNNHV